MTIGITGGTGLVGSYLVPVLLAKGHRIVIFTRHLPQGSEVAGVSYIRWNPATQVCDTDALPSLDAVINLAGAGIADKRWTAARKQEIRNSRVQGTALLGAMLRKHAPACRLFIGASAIGYYGSDRGGEAFAEHDTPGTGFIADTCQQWEQASTDAARGMRLVLFRIGIVLASAGGAFPKFAQPVRLGFMPILGTGRQVVSWVSIADLANMIAYAVSNPSMQGIYNAVAPVPVTQAALVRTIAHVYGGWHLPAPAPPFVLRAVLGGMAGEVLHSATVSASKMVKAGFQFLHPDLVTAVKYLLNK